MTVCRSSFFFPVTRICRSCNWLCTLNPWDLIAWITSLALFPSRPCLIFNSCRAWPTDEIAGSSCSTFRKSTPRLDSLPMTISRSAFKCAPSSATKIILSGSGMISVFASFKSNRVISSFRAWFSALSISCVSTSETMSNEGMALNFGFQTSNFKFVESQNSPSRICLRDLNVAFVDPDLDCRRASAVDYLIDFHFPCRGIRGQRDIIEIIGDLSMGSAGDEVKPCIGGQKDRSISLSDIYMRRELSLFPPIVPERERAAVHCKIQVCETVAGENPSVAQPCVYFSSVHTVQENLARIQFQCGNASCCRDYNGAINCA